MVFQTEFVINVSIFFLGLFIGYLFGRYVGVRDTTLKYCKKRHKK